MIFSVIKVKVLTENIHSTDPVLDMFLSEGSSLKEKTNTPGYSVRLSVLNNLVIIILLSIV